jgi:hypothetical protein
MSVQAKIDENNELLNEWSAILDSSGKILLVYSLSYWNRLEFCRKAYTWNPMSKEATRQPWFAS